MAVTLDRIPAQMQGSGHVDLGNEQVVARLEHAEVAEITSRMRVVPVLGAPIGVDLHQATTAGPWIVTVPGHRVAPRFTPGDGVEALEQFGRPAHFAGHRDGIRALWRERERRLGGGGWGHRGRGSRPWHGGGGDDRCGGRRGRGYRWLGGFGESHPAPR